MAHFNCKFSILVAFVCCAYLLSSTNGMVDIVLGDKGRIMYCLRPSRLWKGFHCVDSGQCFDLCKNKEGAPHGGYCLDSFCYCRRKCCPKPSGTWRGPCFSTKICSKQCIQREKAVDGTCDFDAFACDCLHFC